MALGGFADGKSKCFRHRQPIVILDRRVLFGIKQLCGRGLEPLAILGE
jgi:hypothetical protein